MVTYYIEAEQPCPECQGTGVVQHPAWAAYWQEHHGESLPTAEADERWFREQGYSRIPPEELTCEVCHGTGIRRQRVPLAEALAALGLSLGR
jgi:hypothetical protein